MKVEITEDCISCGKCIEICPEVFEMGEDIAQVKMNSAPDNFEDAVIEAADECPVEAIIVEE